MDVPSVKLVSNSISLLLHATGQQLYSILLRAILQDPCSGGMSTTILLKVQPACHLARHVHPMCVFVLLTTLPAMEQ